MLTVEQVVASHKSNMETLFGLTSKAFEGVEKLVELNLAASKAALSEASAHTQTLMSVKDAQELMALQSNLLQPLAEKTAAYSRHLYDIAQGTSADLTKGFEGKAAEGQQAVQAYIESALKNAPAGSEQAVAFFKQAVTASNTAVESVQKAVKQAADLAESQIQTATETAVKASKSVAKKR